MEDRLLENDFSYDAFEGLEKVSWNQCLRQLEATEARIMDEFALETPTSPSRAMVLGIVSLLTIVSAVWYWSNSANDTVDLTNNKPDKSSPTVEVTAMPDADSLVNHQNQTIEPVSTSKRTADQPKAPDPVKPEVQKTRPTNLISQKADSVTSDKLEHITVGHVVDIKGIPVRDAMVSSGLVTDTTDKSGYYALKIPQGGTQIVVTHLATSYRVEIDSNQSWVIVLDIAGQSLKDYYPLNPANRFK